MASKGVMPKSSIPGKIRAWLWKNKSVTSDLGSEPKKRMVGPRKFFLNDQHLGLHQQSTVEVEDG